MNNEITEDLVKEKIKRLRWMFFDVDGVLTDGSLIYSEKGEVIKKFNVLDGHGIKEISILGIGVGLISSRDHEATRHRAKELGINNLMMNVSCKLEAFENWSNRHKVNPLECGHMGDDLPDLSLMSKVGFAASVTNACDEIKNVSDWISTKAGGHGAVREVCDLIKKFHG